VHGFPLATSTERWRWSFSNSLDHGDHHRPDFLPARHEELTARHGLPGVIILVAPKEVDAPGYRRRLRRGRSRRRPFRRASHGRNLLHEWPPSQHAWKADLRPRQWRAKEPYRVRRPPSSLPRASCTVSRPARSPDRSASPSSATRATSCVRSPSGIGHESETTGSDRGPSVASRRETCGDSRVSAGFGAFRFRRRKAWRFESSLVH
jgi:hypothetical protein